MVPGTYRPIESGAILCRRCADVETFSAVGLVNQGREEIHSTSVDQLDLSSRTSSFADMYPVPSKPNPPRPHVAKACDLPTSPEGCYAVS